MIPSHYTHIEYDSIDSTNLEAKRVIQSGKVTSDFIISAKIQTAGRGRLERSWVSTEGNLFTSICITKKSFELLPFIAALAVGDVLEEFIPADDLKYKWPNDVLISGKKISGILIETINNYAIIGIGINISSYPKSGTNLPATCLNEYSENKISASDVLGHLAHYIDKRLNMEKTDILTEWTAKAYGINKNVTIIQENKEISGSYKGVDENGWLILETNQGKRELVIYGDVSWI
jgi:BirA family biotin operon repressor/biotin-[acetyl-CoA-carboxylase] ligase